MKISTAEGRILSAYQFQADTPVVHIARQLKCQPHTIHYTLRKFQELGVLRRGAFVNLALLGLTLYQMYFSLSGAGIRRKKRLLESLHKHYRVSWYGELGGNFQYGVSFYAREPNDARAFLDEIAQVTGDGVSRKSLATIAKVHFLNKTYLPGSRKADRDVVSISSSAGTQAIDSKDHAILSALLREDCDSLQTISRVTGIARTTVEHRLKALRENQLLHRQIFRISASKLGFHVYRVLIRSRGLSEKSFAALLEFARATPSVVALNETLGAYDAELSVEVEGAEALTKLVEELAVALPQHIDSIDISPVLSQATSTNLFSPDWPLFKRVA
ncbi:MAG: Lrp/AsnC family transcriptional regulator [Bdellovibrionales bacterium]|nr:Lrp/AsnC family transcriptional regulator [Bdellovibrionales bacterium]